MFVFKLLLKAGGHKPGVQGRSNSCPPGSRLARVTAAGQQARKVDDTSLKRSNETLAFSQIRSAKITVKTTKGSQGV